MGYLYLLYQTTYHNTLIQIFRLFINATTSKVLIGVGSLINCDKYQNIIPFIYK